MRKTNSKLLLFLCLSFFIAIEGCDKEEGFSSQDSGDVSDEAVMDAYYQDMDDMASVTISAPTSTEYNGGRTSGTVTVNDNRLNCNGTIITLEILEGSTTLSPKGKITVDFGTTGCTDLKGNVRKGKIIFTYSGKRWTVGTTLVTTTDNYYINGVKLGGTRTTTIVNVTSETDIEYHVVLENGKATFEDQTSATRQSDLDLHYIKGANPADDKLIVGVGSEASGTTRRQRSYVVTLSEALEYHRFCHMAVSGIKNIVIDGNKEIKVDYGDGTCDNTVTVTILNVSRTITVGG